MSGLQNHYGVPTECASECQNHFGVPTECASDLQNHFGVPGGVRAGGAPHDKGSVFEASGSVAAPLWGERPRYNRDAGMRVWSSKQLWDPYGMRF